MGKRPKKKIVLCLVEGKSDINALSYGISELYDSMDSEYEVMFPTLKDENQTGGDITSKYGVKPDNIERLISKLFIENFLKDYGLYPKDLTEIVQIVDLDGAYIDDAAIIETHSGSNGKTIYYNENNIETAYIDSIIERNERKRNNLNYLSSLDRIKIGSKQIPYSIYYMSCNLDHVICNDMNLESGDKCNKSMEFADKCQADETYFINYMCSEELATYNLSYEESWNYVTEGNNSLIRKSNLNVLIERLQQED